MEREVFYTMVCKSGTAESLRADGQSYLLCSKDTDALMFLTEFLICLSENFGGGKDILSFPDVMILPEGERVLVSDIETLTTTAAMTPLALSHKYYIIKNAHTAADSAANKLLKTLEEPPKSVKIIILADSERDVLPTVRSRCRVITLPPFSDETLSRAADRVYADSPFLDKAKRLALGSITRLKKAAAGEFEQAEQLVFSTLAGMKTSTDVAQYSHSLSKKKDGLADIIEMSSLVLSDAIRLHYDLPTVFSHRHNEIKVIAEYYSADTILRLAPAHERALTRLKFNGYAASVIDEFLFSLLEVRQKCK